MPSYLPNSIRSNRSLRRREDKCIRTCGSSVTSTWRAAVPSNEPLERAGTNPQLDDKPVCAGRSAPCRWTDEGRDMPAR
jgi:hypothetical protein